MHTRGHRGAGHTYLDGSTRTLRPDDPTLTDDRAASADGVPREDRLPAAGVAWVASGIELVDTPGVGSVYEHNTAEADDALSTLDAAVFVVTADPPVSASELALLLRVQELSVRTYLVVNKADRLDADERREVVAFTRQAVERAGGSGTELFVGSALQGLQALATGDGPGWAASGMPDLVRALTGQLSGTRQQDLLTSLARAAGRLTRAVLDETTLALRAQELRACRRANELQAFRAVLDGLDRRRDEALAVADADLKRARRRLDTQAAAAAPPIA